MNLFILICFNFSGALAINVVSIWFATTKTEEQVLSWLQDRNNVKDSRNMAASLIQITWRYKRYRYKLPDKHMKQFVDAQRARLMRDLRSLRQERDWKLLDAFNPLYTDVDTLLGFAQVIIIIINDY